MSSHDLIREIDDGFLHMLLRTEPETGARWIAPLGTPPDSDGWQRLRSDEDPFERFGDHHIDDQLERSAVGSTWRDTGSGPGFTGPAPARSAIGYCAALTGDDLAGFLDALGWGEPAPQPVDRLEVAVDAAGFRVKVNWGIWSPPLGTVTGIPMDARRR